MVLNALTVNLVTIALVREFLMMVIVQRALGMENFHVPIVIKMDKYKVKVMAMETVMEIKHSQAALLVEVLALSRGNKRILTML